MRDYWEDEIERENSMYWSYSDAKHKKVSDLKMLPKQAILKYAGYFLFLFAGLLFVLVPSSPRKEALEASGLVHRTENLIHLAFVVFTVSGLLCQLISKTAVLKREPSTLRALGFDRAPLKFVYLPPIGKDIAQLVTK